MGVQVFLKGKSLAQMFNDDAFGKATEDLANQMMDDMDQVVPYSGKYDPHRANTVHLDGNKRTIVYNAPYAKAQFYGMVNGHPVTNYTTAIHEQATKRWDLKAQSIYGDDWHRIVANSFKGKHVPTFVPHVPNEGDPDGSKGKN